MSNEVRSFTLWFRPNRKHPWQAVASAPTSQELTNAIGVTYLPPKHAEYITLPSDKHPDDGWKAKR